MFTQQQICSSNNKFYAKIQNGGSQSQQIPKGTDSKSDQNPLRKEVVPMREMLFILLVTFVAVYDKELAILIKEG